MNLFLVHGCISSILGGWRIVSQKPARTTKFDPASRKTKLQRCTISTRSVWRVCMCMWVCAGVWVGVWVYAHVCVCVWLRRRREVREKRVKGRGKREKGSESIMLEPEWEMVLENYLLHLKKNHMVLMSSNYKL